MPRDCVGAMARFTIFVDLCVNVWMVDGDMNFSILLPISLHCISSSEEKQK